MKPVVQALGQQPTKANLMAAYISRVRSNIHTVLCMRRVSATPSGGRGEFTRHQFPRFVFIVFFSPLNLLIHSPIGEVFRARLRQFPSLVTCCTIDWFNPWPEEALQAVASSFLNELAELEASPAAMRGLVSVCVCLHLCVHMRVSLDASSVSP